MCVRRVFLYLILVIVVRSTWLNFYSLFLVVPSDGIDGYDALQVFDL